MSSRLQIAAKFLCFVCLLPWEVEFVSSEVSVSSGLLVDRTAQIQHFNDTCRTKIEFFADDLNQLLIVQFTCSKGIYHNRCRLCDTDRIGKLDLTALCKSRCHDILGNISCGVGCRTVYLCTILTGKCSAAVTCLSTVGVYDNLASGESAVSVWSTDNETSGRVDKDLGGLIDQLCRNNRVDHIFLDVLMNLLL